jgi:zona occludens toxin (predicted ATPase)
METHRHTGHDLVFITQAPTFVHHHIRKLTGKHIHCYRAMGLKGCTLFKWDGVCDNPNGYHERKLADTERWTYPAELFQCYKSATVHTHKFKIPSKLIWLSGFALLVIGSAVAYGMNSGIAETIEGSVSASPTARSAPGDVPSTFNDITLQEVNNASVNLVSVSGCVSGKFCRCFDRDGNQIDLQPAMCRNLSEGNLALPIKIDTGKQDKKG